MTTLELALWASANSVDFQDVGVTEILEDDEDLEVTFFGAEPVGYKIKPGAYLYYYASNYAFYIEVTRDGKEIALVPDVILKCHDCDDRIFLYKLD